LPNTQFSFCGFSRSFFFFFLNSRCVWSDRQKYPSASYTHNHSNILKENSLRSYFLLFRSKQLKYLYGGHGEDLDHFVGQHVTRRIKSNNRHRIEWNVIYTATR
jgi:hypothetical protein